jgi:hypothetical protein
MRQAAILRTITERLLQSTGIGSGMRVLDLGCGAGDVLMLAAELVDPSGSGHPAGFARRGRTLLPEMLSYDPTRLR